MNAILISEALRLTRVNKGSQGITVLPAAHTFIDKWNEPSCLPQPHSIAALWPVLISRPTQVGGWVGLGGLVVV